MNAYKITEYYKNEDGNLILDEENEVSCIDDVEYVIDEFNRTAKNTSEKRYMFIEGNGIEFQQTTPEKLLSLFK